MNKKSEVHAKGTILNFQCQRLKKINFKNKIDIKYCGMVRVFVDGYICLDLLGWDANFITLRCVK